jgi:threonine aldolase
MSLDLRSDNTLPAHPAILEAVSRANAGTQTSYGSDEFSLRVRARCAEIFERDVDVFPVLTGSAGNALAIGAMTPPWGAVFCHADAHIHRDELGAAEMFTGGAKLMPIPGALGKLEPDATRAVIEEVRDSRRMATLSTLSITQTTEAGTVCSLEEIHALTALAKSNNLRIHMDGARFANAVVSLGSSPADLTWRAGVDILVFGATKNGGFGAELLVVFRKEVAETLSILWHRSGHRPSKARFLAAQLDAYLHDDLWLRNARHANEMAAYLAQGLRAAGLNTLLPVDANIVFVRLPPHTARHLQSMGFQFYDWPIFGPDVYRMVTGFNTPQEGIDSLLGALRA